MAPEAGLFRTLKPHLHTAAPSSVAGFIKDPLTICLSATTYY